MTAIVRHFVVCACSVVALAACAKKMERTPEPDASVLPDQIAGRACKRDADCAVGRCASALHITSASENMQAPGGYCTLPCSTDSQCGMSGECSVPAGETNGECLNRCDGDAQCREGYRCVGYGRAAGLKVSGTCQPAPATSQLDDGIAGLACGSNEDCNGGECAQASPLGSPFPGNYCTARCLDDAQCGAGGGCLAFSGSSNAGHCYARCESDADCSRDGYRCREIGSGFKACYPAPTALPDHTTGKACGTDDDCGGAAESCAFELPFADLSSFEYGPAPGGYCTQVCSLDAECGAGAQCISRGFEGGMCLANCNGDGDCRAGYRCIPHGRDHSASDQVCVPVP